MKKIFPKLIIIGIILAGVSVGRGVGDFLLLLGLLLIVIGTIVILINIARKKQFKKLAIIAIVVILVCLPVIPVKNNLDFHDAAICQNVPTEKRCAEYIHRSLIFLLLAQISELSIRNYSGGIHMDE